MITFDGDDKTIDLVNNPDYDFVSFNINPNAVIYHNDSEDTVGNIRFREKKENVGMRAIFSFIKTAVIILSISAIIYISCLLIIFFASNDFLRNGDFFWFAGFFITFLMPLLIGLFKLITNLPKLLPCYKKKEYVAFSLSTKMFADNRRASSIEISDAIKELLYFFKLSDFADKKQYIGICKNEIRTISSKRKKPSSNSYDDFKMRSSLVHLKEDKHVSCFEIVVELLLGIVGTVLNLLNVPDDIKPHVWGVISIVACGMALAFFAACISFFSELKKFRKLNLYYYIYSYLFLKSVTNRNQYKKYEFKFSVKDNINNMDFFKSCAYELIKASKTLALKKDIIFSFEKDHTVVTVYGIENDSELLKKACQLNSLDSFLEFVVTKTKIE